MSSISGLSAVRACPCRAYQYVKLLWITSVEPGFHRQATCVALDIA